MRICQREDRIALIDPAAFLFERATTIGRGELRARVNVWAHATIRGNAER